MSRLQSQKYLTYKRQEYSVHLHLLGRHSREINVSFRLSEAGSLFIIHYLPFCYAVEENVLCASLHLLAAEFHLDELCFATGNKRRYFLKEG